MSEKEIKIKLSKYDCLTIALAVINLPLYPTPLQLLTWIENKIKTSKSTSNE